MLIGWYLFLPVFVDLSKVSDVIKNDVAKKAVYDELVK